MLAQRAGDPGYRREVQPQRGQGCLLREDVCRRAIQRDSPPLQDDDPAGADGLVHRMGDGNNRQPAAVQAVDKLQDRLAAGRIQHGRGLIEDDAARAHRQDAGQRDPLHLPGGQQVRGPLALLPHADLAQQLFHPPANLCRGQAQVLQAEGDILRHDRGDDLVLRGLKDHPYPGADRAVVARVVRVQAIHPDPPARGDEQGIQVAGQRGLSGAIRAEERDILALVDA